MLDPPWCFQEHGLESGLLTLSGIVEYINSDDDAGTGHTPNKICFFYGSGEQYF